MTKESQSDYRRFYSSNPYEVLGIPKTSSIQDANKAKRKLIFRFHPDRNKDPIAAEITRSIIEAFEKIQIQATNVVHSSYAKEPVDSTADKTTERETQKKEESYETVVADFVRFLGTYPSVASFKKYLDHLRSRNIEPDKLDDLIKSERLFEYALSNCKSDLFSNFASRSSFLKCRNSWQEIGVNLSKILEDHSLINHIKFCTEKLLIEKLCMDDKKGPDFYSSHVKDWLINGVDLSDVINKFGVHKILSQRAKMWLVRHGEDKFKTFVQLWVAVGWKPDIEKLYS
jgi:hypothetical protein